MLKDPSSISVSSWMFKAIILTTPIQALFTSAVPVSESASLVYDASLIDIAQWLVIESQAQLDDIDELLSIIGIHYTNKSFTNSV